MVLRDKRETEALKFYVKKLRWYGIRASESVYFVIQSNFQTDFYMKKHEIKHFVWHNWTSYNNSHGRLQNKRTA
jgi:hypothetical protein